MNPRPPPSLEQILKDPTWLREIARRLVSDEQLIDDLEQDVRVRALENPPQTDKNLRGWLVTVMRNLVISKERRDHIRARHEQRITHERGTEDQPVDIELELLRETVARSAEENSCRS